jgi:glycolate oxidase subunit GlcD
MPHSALVRDLRRCLGAEGVLWAPSELAVYDCDALTIERRRPAAVVFPRAAEDVAEVVRVCRRHGAPIVPRGAGTGLAGGCVAVTGGVVVMLTRMNRLGEINLRDRVAEVEAGVANLQLARALAGSGFHYAPDPSSQGASTIGGNVATNAGGPHTLKYGVTVNHVVGLEVVLCDGSVVRLGPVENPAELDLAGVLVGSEGTLGIVTRAWVRLTPNPEDYRALRAMFDSLEAASEAVSRIIAAGIVPSALELMDRGILDAVEEAFQFGFPKEAGAVLVVEIDGPAAGLDRQEEAILGVLRQCGAAEVLRARDAAERELLWKCRKLAVGATGRLSPSYMIQDGVVPRTRLPQIIRRVAEIGAKHGVRVVNVAHAGDGNVHPILLFDERDRRQVARAWDAGREMLEECIALGGSITAEHGIGIEKLALMERLFGPAELDAMRRVREAFDPAGLFNPGKVLPSRGDGETRRWGDGEIRRWGEGETVQPADQQGIVEAVRRAADAATPVYPVGGATALDYGATPDRPGLRLSTAAVNRLIDYAPDDMTVTVEAGMTIAELARLLAQRCQRLPIDAAESDRATIGGLVATNPQGPRRHALGSVRDYVLGLRAVDGRGTAFSAGGRVVKNAAGYNLCRLMVGSLGTLGVVTQATLMVRPMPETTAWAVCDVADLASAEELLAALGASPVSPVAVELLAGEPRNDGSPLDPMPDGAAARLVVGFEGAEREVVWMLGRLADDWRPLGVGELRIARGAEAEAVGSWLVGLPAHWMVLTRPSRVVETVARLLETEPGCAVQCHAAGGAVRVALGENVAAAEFGPLVRERWRPMVEALGARLVVLSAPAGAGLSPGDVWGPPGPAAGLVRALRERFDPHGILNPGRIP